MNAKKYFRAAVANPLSVPWKLFNIVRRIFPVDYWFLNGWSFPPEMVTILITKRCNFSCVGCSSSSPQYTKNYKEGEFTTQEFKNFIDKIAWFKPGIYFCGGEPTLRNDLYELIKHAKTKGLVTAFTTNGSLLTSQNIKNILDSGVDFISLSLDGAPEHHNKYRGYPKAYEKLTDGLVEFLRQKSLRKFKSPSVRITCIINPEDKSDSLFVLKKAEELGVDEIAFGNLMFFPSFYREKQKAYIKKTGVGGLHMIGLEVKEDKIPFKIDKIGLKNLYKEIKRAAKIPTYFVPEKIDYEDFFSFKMPSDKSFCLSPWTIATLLPNGLLTSCQEFILGDTKKESFMSLWNNEKMKKFRKLRKKGIFPACFRCIEGQEIKFD